MCPGVLVETSPPGVRGTFNGTLYFPTILYGRSASLATGHWNKDMDKSAELHFLASSGMWISASEVRRLYEHPQPVPE